MLDVTIDAGVLAVPSPVSSADQLHDYVDTLLDWSKLLDEPWVAIHISEGAAGALFEDKLYPLRDQLEGHFQHHGIVEYDVNTVARVTERLLALTPSFETYYRVRDVLADSLDIDPDIVNLTTHVCLKSDLARCVLLISILRKHCRQPLAGHSLILRSARGSLVKVRAQIHEIVHEREDLPALPSPPNYFEGDVLVCDDFKGLAKCLDESAILKGACDIPRVKLAIKVALFKEALAKGEEPDWSDTKSPMIGKRFLETLHGCCRDQGGRVASSILRAIIETARNRNMAAVHALRTGRGGGDPQRMRGSEKAQRRDIDYELHLHYWECADENIELASIVHHNDFSIPE
ncbi:MAG: hypothetical protein FWD68_19230 [Alphaproteobacteria bacterium]|nr:hypothetical protein [Alphaproteobacteria bacterium]